MQNMMLSHDIPYQESHLQPVGLSEVYTRLCGNLINIYNHSRNVTKMRILLDMLLAIQLADCTHCKSLHCTAAAAVTQHRQVAPSCSAWCSMLLAVIPICA